MEFALRLDQPDLANPGASRRRVFGPASAPAFAILNGRGRDFEGGADEPELSLKWLAQGRADYRTEGRSYRLADDTQLLLNRGQPYRMRMTGESFVVFFPKFAVDAAWQALSGQAGSLPEIPTVAAASPALLQRRLHDLRQASRADDPGGDELYESVCALLNDVVELARARRAQADRLPVIRKTTRDELLRRLLRAEAYLLDTGAGATLDGAAGAAALSPFHLIRVFEAAFGETPLAYAAMKRLDWAHSELIESQHSISEIARRAGYESRNAFDRAFRRRHRMTPGAVRAAR